MTTLIYIQSILFSLGMTAIIRTLPVSFKDGFFHPVTIKQAWDFKPFNCNLCMSWWTGLVFWSFNWVVFLPTFNIIYVPYYTILTTGGAWIIHKWINNDDGFTYESIEK